jgi:hypothetical protein
VWNRDIRLELQRVPHVVPKLPREPPRTIVSPAPVRPDAVQETECLPVYPSSFDVQQPPISSKSFSPFPLTLVVTVRVPDAVRCLPELRGQGGGTDDGARLQTAQEGGCAGVLS